METAPLYVIQVKYTSTIVTLELPKVANGKNISNIVVIDFK
jgi:hypothetical protein